MAWRSTAAGVIALAGWGCGNDAKQAMPAPVTATASSTATSAPEPVLKAVWGDERIALEHAYLVSAGTTALTLRLSDRRMECADVNYGTYGGSEGHVINLMLAHKLLPDGSRKWTIARAQAYGFGEQTLRDDRKAPGAINVATADAEKGLSAKVELSLGHEEALGKLALSGEILAKGCGVEPPKREVPADLPQNDLKFTVAGQPFAIRGAKLTLEKDRKVLDLATAPQDCSFNAVGEIGFSLGLKPKGGTHAFLRGDAIQNNLNTSGKLEIEVVMGAKSGDRQLVELRGQTTLFDYEVAVDGKVSAIVCDNR